MDVVLDFIKRRFKNDCNWVNGNCYYMALIIKDRFPDSKIFYDVIDGHFCTKVKDIYYDWNGIYVPIVPIEWDKFDGYDSYQKEIIIRDCLM